jgi:hypothetical protein
MWQEIYEHAKLIKTMLHQPQNGPTTDHQMHSFEAAGTARTKCEIVKFHMLKLMLSPVLPLRTVLRSMEA